MDVKYEYDEDKIIADIMDYINNTYTQHYSRGEKIQTTKYIMSHCDYGIDFLRGNVLKYISRFGYKEGNNKKDLLKAIHYIIWMIYYSEEDK